VAHKHFWQSRLFFICVIAGAVIAAALAIMMLESDTPVQTYAGLPDEESFDDASFERDGKWYGLCSKNSIHSIEDFRQTVMNDPVLRIHYADFQWEEAVMKKLEKPTPAYVYFRKNDVIFRKTKAIELPAGDEYITDGKTRVRTHCCNDYAEAPPLVASDVAEAPEDPLPGASPKSVLPAAQSVPSSGKGGTSYASSKTGGHHGIFFWRNGGHITPNPPPLKPPDPPQPPDKPPVSVPEPNGIILFGLSLGIIAIVIIERYRAIRKNKGSIK